VKYAWELDAQRRGRELLKVETPEELLRLLDAAHAIVMECVERATSARDAAKVAFYMERASEVEATRLRFVEHLRTHHGVDMQ
jgi:hypothetical protein